MISRQEFKQGRDLVNKCSNPIFYSKRVLGSALWKKQQEIAQSVGVNKYTAVRSCFGAGKTKVAADIVLWFLSIHQPSKVITTAPTWLQVEKLLWAEIAKSYHNARVPIGGRLLTTELKVDDDWFALGLSPKIDVDREAERFQGFHAPYVLVIIDEAAGVDTKLWQAARGLILNDNCRFLAIGNPGSPIGDFFNCFKDPLWNPIHISAFVTPNVVAGKEVIPGLVTREWIEDRKKDWGESNPLYISKVLAEFPEEAEDVLILLSWVDAAKNAILEASGPKGLGVDVARFGTDWTVITAIHGSKVLEIKAFQGKDTMQTVGWTINTMRKWDIPAHSTCIDDVGVGGGVTDRLHEEGHMVQPVNAGAKTEDPGQFFNLSAEMHWAMRKRFETGNIDIPDNEQLLSQLPARKYSMTSKNQIKIESKDEMKKRGLKSPDFADSLVLAIHGQKFHAAGEGGPRVTVIECEQ